LITCRELISFLIEYLEGTLSHSERERFDAHLARCTSCVAYLRTYEITLRLERTVAADCEPPEELVQAVLASRGL
jgi:anti-sigma factor RsiW